jgi:multisubunit Na+/H+ antiporter MnhE subunit
VRRLAAGALWWAFLLGVWVLLVGTKDELELIAGACAAAIGAAAVDAVCSRGLLRFRFAPAWLATAWRPLARVLPEFIVAMRALVRALTGRGRVRGRFRAVQVETGGDTPLGAGRRAFLTVAGSIAPNTLVVDVDRERDLVLLHELEPGEAAKPPL